MEFLSGFTAGFVVGVVVLAEFLRRQTRGR